MQEIEDKYKAEAKTLKERIKELSVENSTNLIHCNKHYKDLMRAQTKIADLKHEIANAKLEVEPLSAELSQAREELEAMKASPARLFKGFIVALWNKAINREIKENMAYIFCSVIIVGIIDLVQSKETRRLVVRITCDDKMNYIWKKQDTHFF